jgi:Icc-related predicted phosphoesterase
LKGEDPEIYNVLGSEKYEKVLKTTKTTFAVHGHAHYGIPLAFVDSIPVFNVALTVNRKIVEIDTNKLPKTGLHKFTR